jgi:biopolymer transport protein ExbD
MPVRREKDSGVDVEINRVITPMLDLAFQVLLFFILTYHPSQLEEGQIDLTLPDAAQAQAATPKDASPDPSLPGDLELPSEISVLVKTQHDGSELGGISQISVQERQGAHDEPDPEGLRKYLLSARTGLSNQNDIKIQADKGLKYAYVMQIVDVCNRAGFRNVSFGPPPDLQPGD